LSRGLSVSRRDLLAVSSGNSKEWSAGSRDLNIQLGRRQRALQAREQAYWLEQNS
jgi:hypothetical protein